jgi:hypothetical protein
MGLLAVKNYQIKQLNDKLVLAQPKARIAPKPLPDKIIPAPTPEPIVSTPVIASVETQQELETNFPDTNDAEFELAKSRAERAASKAAAIQQTKLNVQTVWTNNLPIYNYALESLYNILKEEAQTRSDGIAKTEGYFQCLPSIAPEIEETNVAEIRFIARTNMDFQIGITTSTFVMGASIIVGGGDPTKSPGIKIHCDCGNFEIISLYNQNQLFVTAWFNDDPSENERKRLPIQESKDFINHCLKILVAKQIAYLSSTNKQ